ncbi:hypothetical protein [Dactylosporangium sp. NPDC005555]|uniref:hypothetical protein n=1 Tax=Dactylosporangium sp. NPDC005555 TaxID=3154889 RepID=UPI0033AAB3C0
MQRIIAMLVAVCSAAVVVVAAPGPARAADPSYPAGMYMWLRGNLGQQTTGGKVYQWNDWSGNGRNATMTVDARRPTLVNNALGWAPAVRFSGAQSLNLPIPISATTFSIFIVGQNNNPGSSLSPVLGPGGMSPNNQLNWVGSSYVQVVGTSNNLPVIQAPVVNVGFHILGLVYNGSQLKFYRNSTLLHVANATTTGPWVLAQIGAYYSQYFLTGDIVEILVYPRALTDTERTNTQNLIRGTYNLPA